jgi:uncharacterized pyridoxamine 5'-phosphate oxidase family protein
VSSIVREDKQRPQFLHLDTIGWKTTNRHRIEIWFVEHDKRYYILSERKKRAHWVQNILRNPKILFTVNNKNFDGYARVTIVAVMSAALFIVSYSVYLVHLILI